MVIYVYAYFAVGLVSLLLVLGSHFRQPLWRRRPELAQALEALNDPRSQDRRWRLVRVWVLPVLAAVLVVVAWPLAVYWGIKGWYGRRKTARRLRDADEFVVQQEHLVRPVSLAEIEAAEMVIDPLGGAPRLPFGRRHAQWESFKATAPKRGQLWLFCGRRPAGYQTTEVFEGYALVRWRSKIGPVFIARRFEIHARDEARWESARTKR
ncbi:hypothetical protein [Caldimonas taiwanensis]|uniref:hypothetical protein n=1 Tax=Caldimonas taiwanensis TaxID=307483 RepID=UPI0007867BF8|nr:hypothetical protein [Caldimonas taiwanensis]